jgi:hypothetical protein
MSAAVSSCWVACNIKHTRGGFYYNYRYQRTCERSLEIYSEATAMVLVVDRRVSVLFCSARCAAT